MKKFRILVADDHHVVREGARLIIDRDPECEVCAVVSSGREAVEQAALSRPDVVVLDLHMPDMDGFTAVREIKAQNPDVELVIFSGERSEEVITRLFQAGVKSFIPKTDISDMLLNAVKAAANHKPFVTPEIGEILFGARLGTSSGAELTPREREIARLVADGNSNKSIAASLGISPRTAETHRAALMRKLGASSIAEVVRYAIRNGLIQA